MTGFFAFFKKDLTTVGTVDQIRQFALADTCMDDVVIERWVCGTDMSAPTAALAMVRQFTKIASAAYSYTSDGSVYILVIMSGTRVKDRCILKQCLKSQCIILA